MSDGKSHEGTAFVAGMALAFLIAIVLGDIISDATETQATKSCGAYYHPQTGKFTWKECAP